MAYTVFDGVAKFTADSSQLDQFIVKLEHGLTTASEKAAASTRELKTAQEEFRASIAAVSAEGGNTTENLQRLAEAERQLALAAAAAKQEHAALKDGLGVVKKQAEESGYSMMEARHSVMLLGEEFGVHMPRAVSTMIASIGPIGSILAVAFPIVGALALIAIVAKVIEHHEKLQATLRKNAEEEVNLKIKEEDRTASLEITNLRIEDQIKKLEGRPATNQLAIALREVQVRADDLATSFAKDFQAMDEDVANLNGLMQKFADYTVNALKGFPGDNADVLIAARMKETEAVKRVQEAEVALEKTRIVSHDAATKDAATQQTALGQQAIAAGKLQAAYDTLADSVAKVDPNNLELIEKLRSHAKSAEADWKDLAVEIRGVGDTAKQTSETVARELAKRAESSAKVDITGTEKLGILDADAIRQAGEKAYAAETAATKQLLDADILSGQQREQVELSLIPRMATAEKALNDSKLDALKSGHAARLAALEAERADILKYEVGDEQLKALKENNFKQKEENKKYELDRQKQADDGEKKLTEIAGKGATDRIALQKALQKAVQELTKADEELGRAESKLAEGKLSQHFSAQEQAITRLAEMHIITEQQKNTRLKQLEQQQSAEALAILRQEQQEAAVETLEGNPLFGAAQVADLKKNLKAAEGDLGQSMAVIKAAFAQTQKDHPFLSEAQVLELKASLNKVETAYTNTEAQIVQTQEKFNKQSEANDKSHYGRALLEAMSFGRELLAEQLKQTHAELAAAQTELALAKARHEDTTAIQQKVDALKQHEQALEKEAAGNKSVIAAHLQLHQSQLVTLQGLRAEIVARGGVVTAIDKQIEALKKLVAEEQLEQTQGNKTSTAWQQFAAQFKKGATETETTAQKMGQMVQASAQQMQKAFESAMSSAILSQASFGAALEKATAQILAQISAQAGVQAIYSLALGFLKTAEYDYVAADAAFTAAAEFGLLSAAAGVAAHAMSGSGGAAATPQGPVSTTGGSSTVAGGGGPTTINVAHLAAGGVVTEPTLVVLGDSKRGGRAREAIIPLEDDQAMSAIGGAMAESFMRSMFKSSSLPRMAEGGLVTMPTFLMAGDDRSGGAATEAILPLSDPTAMGRIVDALSRPSQRYAPEATSALIPPSVLAMAARATEAASESAARNADSPRDAQQIAKALAAALDGKTPLSGSIAVESSSSGDTHFHNHAPAINLKGSVSHDAKMLAKEINKQVKKNLLHLQSSTSFRKNSRGQ